MKIQHSKFNIQNLEHSTSYFLFPIHPFTHSPIYFLKKFFLPLSYFLISLSFFLTGCAVKTTSVFVTINSPKIKIADEGFLKEGFGYKQLIIYKAGNEPVKFTLKQNEICINNECVNKYVFMQKYFKGLKKDVFDKILNKKPLALKFYKKTKDGFIEKSENIYYRVSKNSVLFKDKKEKTVIFIKYLRSKND